MKIILPLSLCILAASIAVAWWRERHTPKQTAAPAQSFHPTFNPTINVYTTPCTDDKQNDKSTGDYPTEAYLAYLDAIACQVCHDYPYGGPVEFDPQEIEALIKLRDDVWFGTCNYAGTELENGDFGGC